MVSGGNNMDKLGIPSNGFEYHRILSDQDIFDEFKKTLEFLNEVFLDRIKKEAPELANNKLSLHFINYGDTQLVYVFSTGTKRYAVLVGQPATEMGTVKKEFANLRMLSENNQNEIVTPIYYFANNNRELYIAPYIFQSRCIASQDNGWGLYIPEPHYRFELFNEEERFLVNSSIIANLVRLYDSKNNCGIGSCKVGGGDFILERQWSFEAKTLDNTIKRMKLIAARELITTSFENYINLLRKEFSIKTYYSDESEKDKSILINHKSRIPMTEEEIETGIELGIKVKKLR